MKTDMLMLIGIAMSLLTLYVAVKLAVKVINGRILLSRARKSGEIIVKGVNVVYKTQNYLFAIATDLFLTAFVFWAIYKYKINYGYVVVIAASLIVNDIIHIIALFAEKDVYLTPNGLVYFLGSFKFSDCRFSWDSTDTPDFLSDKLYIYKKNENIPFIASFEERETAHRIVNEYSVRQQQVSR